MGKIDQICTHAFYLKLKFVFFPRKTWNFKFSSCLIKYSRHEIKNNITSSKILVISIMFYVFNFWSCIDYIDLIFSANIFSFNEILICTSRNFCIKVSWIQRFHKLYLNKKYIRGRSNFELALVVKSQGRRIERHEPGTNYNSGQKIPKVYDIVIVVLRTKQNKSALC